MGQTTMAKPKKVRAMKNFITNSNTSILKKRIIQLIQKSDELKFLVGFFYFSGIRELYEGLKNKPEISLKVLVGLSVDRLAFGLSERETEDDNASDEEKAYKFVESVRKSLNNDDFDNEEFYTQVNFFIELVRSGRLIIRKTYEPNHAKLYIFKLQDDQVGRKNLFITGSSNLTKAGITTQNEFNVEISDFGVQDAEDYFDGLWEKGVRLTEESEIKKKIIEAVEKETHIKELSPFEAFVLVLKTYLDSIKHERISESLIELMEARGYKPFMYQLDAVRQALAIIKEHQGVVIADVVGLGKSIIASLVARSLNRRGIIICPPGLVGDRNKESGWKKYAEEFGLYDWEVRSLGGLEDIAQFVKDKSDIEVVIIDEAHRFRNEDTQNYEHLKNICRGRVVILLTATPFNNKPNDILSLLELFITPKRSGITLEWDLKAKFRMFSGTFDKLAFVKKHYNSELLSKKKKAEIYYQTMFGDLPISLSMVQSRAHYLSKQIRDVIEPVTIRRNRLDLQNDPEYKKEVKELSIVDDPEEWYFELTEAQSRFYDEVLYSFFVDPDTNGQFKGAIYRPFEYESAVDEKAIDRFNEEQNKQYQQQRNLYDFMRRMLVKRFESSFGAFEQSIKNFRDVHNKVLTFIKNSKGRYILDRSLIDSIYDSEPDEIDEKLKEYAEKLDSGNFPKNNRIYNVEKFDRKKEFIDDIKSDIILFEKILRKLADLRLVDEDPKAACLITHIKDELKAKPKKGKTKQKVIIFSEYADTVKRIYEKYLKPAFGDRVLVVAGDLPASKVKTINGNFDASHKKQADDYDILLTTDKISEGFNLNRAGMIINYDIPWNPVRVIQRVGRINRISKKVFDRLYIVNFFPTEKGASVVRSREIAQHKMFLIHSTLGEDAKIFDVDEEPSPAALFTRIQQSPDKLQSESFYTKVRREYSKIKANHPEVIQNLKNCPTRVKVAKKSDENNLYVFIRKGRLYVRWASVINDTGEIEVSETTLDEVYEKIECEKDEKRLELSQNFWETYQKAKKFKARHTNPLSEISLEKRAYNNISFLLKTPWENLMPYLDFMRTLRSDIENYGTLPDFTLRRLANIKCATESEKKQAVEEIARIHKELGEDYLQKETEKIRERNQEVIIAIENRKR